MTLSIVNSIWIGPKLGKIHIACLRSFLRHGHKVVLHSYAQPNDVPTGVEVADANELLPKEKIFIHKTGSIAPFTDLLRYELLKQNKGLYVDCDMFCIKPISDKNYILAGEEKYLFSGDSYIRNITCVGNSVLKLPVDCPALNELRNIKHMKIFIPPWYNRNTTIKYKIKNMINRVKHADSPYTAMGPQALLYYLEKHSLIHKVQPLDIFYPVDWTAIDRLLCPGLEIEDVVTHRTLALHLNNFALNQRIYANQLDRLPDGCILKKIVTTYPPP